MNAKDLKSPPDSGLGAGRTDYAVAEMQGQQLRLQTRFSALCLCFLLKFWFQPPAYVSDSQTWADAAGQDAAFTPPQSSFAPALETPAPQQGCPEDISAPQLLCFTALCGNVNSHLLCFLLVWHLMVSACQPRFILNEYIDLMIIFRHEISQPYTPCLKDEQLPARVLDVCLSLWLDSKNTYTVRKGCSSAKLPLLFLAYL